jgi:hypothetical protein
MDIIMDMKMDKEKPEKSVYSNFIRDCINNKLPMDKVMKTEIEFLLKTYSMERFIDIMVYDFIPSLHHEANSIKENNDR